MSSEWDPENGGIALIEMVQPGQRISKDIWEDCIDVLKAFHKNTLEHHCRTWMSWSSSLVRLLRYTINYTPAQAMEVENIVDRWAGLIERTKTTWSLLVHVKCLETSGLDELDVTEQNLLLGEDVREEHDILLEPDDIEVEYL